MIIFNRNKQLTGITSPGNISRSFTYDTYGRISVVGDNISVSGKGRTAYEKIRDRARFRRRAAIEPVIGHLKSDYRMLRNYLKGIEGDMINTILAAASFNMMKKLRQIRDAIYIVLDWLTRNWSVKYNTVWNY